MIECLTFVVADADGEVMLAEKGSVVAVAVVIDGAFRLAVLNNNCCFNLTCFRKCRYHLNVWANILVYLTNTNSMTLTFCSTRVAKLPNMMVHD